MSHDFDDSFHRSRLTNYGIKLGVPFLTSRPPATAHRGRGRVPKQRPVAPWASDPGLISHFWRFF